MERTQVKDVFSMKGGEKVLLKGWVHDTRDLKKVRFIVLKDISGTVQIVGVNGETPAKVLDEFNVERYCCRAAFLGQTDILELVNEFKKF